MSRKFQIWDSLNCRGLRIREITQINERKSMDNEQEFGGQVYTYAWQLWKECENPNVLAIIDQVCSHFNITDPATKVRFIAYLKEKDWQEPPGAYDPPIYVPIVDD